MMEDILNFTIISSDNGDGWKQTKDSIHMVGSSIYGWKFVLQEKPRSMILT